MDTRMIDFTNMTEEDQVLIAVLLLQSNDLEYIPGNEYEIDNQKIKLSHTLIRRERRLKEEKSAKVKGGDALPTTRFEVVLNKIGYGGESNIFNANTFYLDKQEPPRLQLIQKKEGKQRVVKQFKNARNERIDRRLSEEYNVIKKSPYLKPKKPTFGKNNFFVMRKLAGVDLVDRILLCTNDLSSCFEIALNIIDAYHEQIRNLNIVHNDIKPENIMIDKDNKIVFIDYSFQTKVGEYSHSGSKNYWSPQRLQYLPLSFADDEYALVLSIAQVFNIIPNVELCFSDEDSLDYLKNNDALDFIYSLLVSTQEIEEAFEQLFKAATAYEVKDRMDITEFRKQLEHIKLKVEGEAKNTVKIK